MARAETARARRRDNGLTFGSIRVALGWYFTMKERIGNPNTQRMRTSTKDGAEVLVDVDFGARGSSLEEVHATLLTINNALNTLASEPEGGELRFNIVMDAHRDGRSQEDIAKNRHMSQATVSRELYAAEAFIVGMLRGEGGVLS